ncbi:uncharacterized protein LOC117825544 [Notolabrus celidotus]|uniref:uncharacterized protein LOC117825544 n=1 Tax=Notolabrus celidotus TaxID=1203425 RepID=UPI00148FCB5B|nr:uncharacterized protein LOC117825544 [Notolabrus celidotus]
MSGYSCDEYPSGESLRITEKVRCTTLIFSFTHSERLESAIQVQVHFSTPSYNGFRNSTCQSATTKMSVKAALQTSPLSAPSGLLLLLLIGVISCHLPGVQARPIDFWCNREARKHMGKAVEGLKKEMADCVGSHMLPSPLQLPCVWVQPAEWANKTLQQKRAEVLGAFQVFRDGVHGAANQTTLQCQTSLLERLGHHVTNYVGLVSSLQIQNDMGTSSQPAAQNCPPERSLKKVLEQYGRLLKGKLERFAVDLKDSMCKEEHSTANT